MSKFSPTEMSRIQEGLPPWDSMSFACGGWLQFYMFGVAKALQEAKLDKGVSYAGCSAGSLTAVGLICGGDFDGAVQHCQDAVIPSMYNSLFGLFRLPEYCLTCTSMSVFDPFNGDVSLIPKGKLQIAVTKLPFFTTERVTYHESKETLMLTILASCAAFPLSPIVYRNNSWYIDGGISDFQPMIDDDTITVSPFYFCDCDIKPSRYVPVWWSVFPPKDKATIEWLYNLGKEDCRAYIHSRGIPIASGDQYFKSRSKGSYPSGTNQR